MSTLLADAIRTVVPTLNEGDRQVLQALLFAPSQSASAGQLRTLLGLKAVVQVNGAMGRIGRRVQEALGAHPEGLAAGEYEWWHVIATGGPEKGRGFVWRLREEIVAGLLACGYSSSGDAPPNDTAGGDRLFEGAVRQVTVNAYERNPVARARCIEAHGSSCCVCGFNFGAVYGAVAAGFIRVHHIEPLALVGARCEVDPVKDLRPVCPNCHAVIHMVDPPRSIDEVKALVESSETSKASSQRTASGSC